MVLPSSFPELGALDLFVSVVELGSLSRAAQAHHITQPSASARIRNLEKRLGLTLIERSPTGSTPTPEGSVVAGWATGVLRSAEELATGVSALQAKATGLLRLAASFTIAEYLLPPWLEQFVRNRPGDHVALQVANSALVIELLMSGQVDLGFIESSHRDAHLSEQVVATDELITVVGPHHPWAKRQSVPIEGLAATPLVLRERGSGTREALVDHLAEAGFGAPIVALELGSAAAVRMAVASGSSPTVVSQLAVATDLEAGTLIRVDIAGMSIRRQLRAVWSTRTERPALASALLKQLPKVDSST